MYRVSISKTYKGGSLIVVIGGIKGGTGKTTLATNLVVYRNRVGKKSLLVDADEQGSALSWSAQRTAMGINTSFSTVNICGPTVNKSLLKFVTSYDDIIIDAGGRDTTTQRSALTVADVLVVPFKPRAFDIWTINSVISLVREVRNVNPKLIVLAVLNQADASGSDNMQAISILQEANVFRVCIQPIVNRKAFANTATQGLGIHEEKRKDKKAIRDLESLTKEIYGDI